MKGREVWRPGCVLSILSNEKYCGDALCQKTVTLDFLTHKSVKNKGLEPQYFIEGNHIPIIEKSDWIMAQQIRKERRYVKRRSTPRKPRIVMKGPLAVHTFTVLEGHHRHQNLTTDKTVMVYVNGSGGFQVLVDLLEPLAMRGGKVGFTIISTLVGIFGVGGTAVAQVAVIDAMFKPLVEALQLNLGVWAMCLLIGSQITSFAYPGNDMMGAMALARCTSIKPMLQLAYKWIIPSTFLLTVLWAVIFG